MLRRHPRLALLLIAALALSGVAATCTTGLTSGVKFGADRKGARITGEATSFPVSTQTVYVEVDSSHKFNATQMTIQVVQHNGDGDKVVDSGTIDVAADDNVESFPLTPSTYGAGTYRVVASVNNSEIANGTVTFK